MDRPFTRLERIHTSGKRTDLQYNVVYHLMNAVDFGVPQHRSRVFVVGVRSDMGVNFSFPQRTHEKDALLHSMWVSRSYWDRHRLPSSQRPVMTRAVEKQIEHLRLLSPDFLLQPWRTVRDAIADLPKIKIGGESKKVWNHYLNPARSYAGHSGSPLDEPAKTLKAGDHGVPGGENTVRLADGSVRYFSVRECAAASDVSRQVDTRGVVDRGHEAARKRRPGRSRSSCGDRTVQHSPTRTAYAQGGT